MSINIKNKEAERRLAQAFAAARRLQVTWAAAEVLAPRPIDEILACDENGRSK